MIAKFSGSSIYTYRIFDLLVKSQISCPELIQSPNSFGEEKESDIVIKFGFVPQSLGKDAFTGVRFETKPGLFLMHVDGVADYLVCNGKEIIIQPASNADEDAIRLFLLGSAFGAVLHMRNILALHGSCVCNDSGAYALVGKSGAGKSTLAASLCTSEFNLLSDDICAIQLDKHNNPVVLPAYPQLKLWADALDELGIDVSKLRKVRPQVEKHALKKHNMFCKTSVPLRKIYLLSPHHQDTTEIKPIDSELARFKILRRHTYREKFLEGLQTQTVHFSQISTLSHTLPCSSVQRPVNFSLYHELIENLKTDMMQCMALSG